MTQAAEPMTTEATGNRQLPPVTTRLVLSASRAACLWHKTTRFSQQRYYNNGWETVPGSTKDLKLDSFVKGEYPH